MRVLTESRGYYRVHQLGAETGTGLGERTATNVDNRLLELAETSVRYFLVHRFACSLRKTALETVSASRCWSAVGVGVEVGGRSFVPGILAIASC